MRKIDLQTVIEATHAKVFSEVEGEFLSIGTDTRVDLKNQLFIALKGDTFDAHDYLLQAHEKGASALMVHRFPEELSALRGKVTIFVVKDTLKALQELARFVRRKKANTVVGITGSNGKTTTKEFSAAILSSKKKVHFSKGSFNNHWGVPFSLLQEPEEAQISVIEMGMNHGGEITELCKIAEPDIVVCTTVGQAHIEHFGTIEKIAEAKEEIYEAAPASARRIYNLDNPYTQKMFLRSRTRFPQSDRIVSFSQMNPKADVYFQLDKVSMEGLQVKGRILKTEGSCLVPVFGSQNLINLMAASAVALSVGMSPEDIWPALSRCHTTWGRNQIVHSRKGYKILFDAYNANPDSMNALVSNLSLIDNPKKSGVFAQMLELGNSSEQAHYELGKNIGASGLHTVWFYGADKDSFQRGLKDSCFSGKVYLTAEFDEKVAQEISQSLVPGEVVIVKGSRGMKLERFVACCEPLDFASK